MKDEKVSNEIEESPSAQSSHSDLGIDRKDEAHLHELARHMTSVSTAARYTSDPENPFLGTNDPCLDPTSEKFSLKLWLQTLINLAIKQQGEVPRKNIGVSFRNLSAYGFGLPTDYQKDFFNVLLESQNLFQKMVGKGQKRRIDILRNFDGLVKPGEMLVVLGRPGSGCTTLLKTLAGDINGYYVDSESVLNYQGIPMEKMHGQFRGETIYNAETEIHFPNLTVGQTLAFAAKARIPRNRIDGVSREQHAHHLRDVVMALFGLSHTVNTKVGNDYIRGVSGGERKRVSIAEAFLSECTIQCWDNSTRGLDSATALEFVKTLRVQSNVTGTSAVVAIYQASQSAYDVFDKVTLLYEGRQIYFGHINDAKKYFIDMGFSCPERQTTADFLTSITSASERIVEAGFESRVPRTPDEFAAAWKKSADHARLLEEIHAFEQEYKIGGEQLEQFEEARRSQQARFMRVKSPYTISVPMQIKLCFDRGIQRLNGDKEIFFVTVLGNWILGIILGSIYYNIPKDASSFYSRGALLFFTILLNALSSSTEILSLYIQRSIVEKHSRYAFYHPFTEAFASMLTELPSKILVAISLNLTVYFMADLRREVGAFFTFFIFSFIMTLTMSNIFRTIASFTRTLSQAMVPASFAILALTIYTGFAIPISGMHPWFRWINYIDPIGYAFESLMINEFRNRQFPCLTYVPAGPGYENATGVHRTCTAVGKQVGAEFVEGNDYLKTAFKYEEAHLWRNLGILIAFFLFFFATYLFGTEYVSAERSKGEILVFKRGHIPTSMITQDDEESGAASGADNVAAAITDAGDSEEIVIQKQTAVFHWKDLVYDIKIKGQPRRLLDHVDGWVKPGTLTALMGASGAGKTTLLDTLASRVTMGVVSGDMLVDGHLRDESFQRKTGYVQQQDLHLQTSTVREALNFSALLRQPQHVSKQEKLDYVDQVIKLLEMQEYSDAVVGVPGEGLNVEQRKRLTIGVELAAKPQLLLFLDEPTSGLDSQTAWSICALLRKLAENGQAILCTIHQPSAVLFQSFDRLLLLAKGGRTVYFGDIGDNSQTLIDYFERRSDLKCPPEANPAEYMLEVIGAAPGSKSDQDWPQLWRESEERREIRRQLDQMVVDLPKTSQIDQSSADAHQTFAQSFGYQSLLVTRRCFEQYWRTPSYLWSKVVLCTLPALFIGFSFWNEKTSMQGLQNQMFSIFMLMIVFGNLNQQIMPQFVTQRALYEVRERPSKTYSWQTFILSNIFVELPWNALMAVIMFFCWYYPIGMYKNAEPTNAVHERGFLMFLLILTFLLFTSTFTHMMIAGMEMVEAAGTLSTLLFSLTLMFCGVLATPQQLPGFWIFMYRVSPFTYLISAMMSTGLANTTVQCSAIELARFQPAVGQTCGKYMETYMASFGGKLEDPNATTDCGFCAITSTNQYLAQVSSKYSTRWRDFGIMWVFIVFNVFAAIALYWVVRVPKNTRKIKGSKDMPQEVEGRKAE
ncbi:ATP binding cassette transporter [Lophium mytilinum]|uniref:ATP binding cassette transporter n=1 Tax=Lophium mytilinum TaxID=390894 RepID=A0A6A6QRC1_9PEZI|nr:ATP binding cassette transporter [Lophium mytilinum]